MRQAQQDNQPPDPVDGVQWSLNLFRFLTFVWAVPVQTLMRKLGTVGRRTISWHFILGALWPMLFCASLGPKGNHQPAVVFSAMVGGMAILHAIKCDRKGHSPYCGDSGLGYGRLVYTVREPLVFLLAGFCVALAFKGIGLFMMLSAGASGRFHSYLDALDRARARNLNDAALEQQYLIEFYKKEYRDG
jgi:hypothetical protein